MKEEGGEKSEGPRSLFYFVCGQQGLALTQLYTFPHLVLLPLNSRLKGQQRSGL